jgi:hypothetical protein
MSNDSSATKQPVSDGEIAAGELLPCPFCCQPPVSFPSGISDQGLMIQCVTPGCVNPHTSWIPPQVAIEKWNTRSPAVKPDTAKNGERT